MRTDTHPLVSCLALLLCASAGCDRGPVSSGEAAPHSETQILRAAETLVFRHGRVSVATQPSV